MNIPWHTSNVFPPLGSSYHDHQMIQLAIATPRTTAPNHTDASSLQQSQSASPSSLPSQHQHHHRLVHRHHHHHHRQGSIGCAASNSSKTDENSATTTLPTPSDDGVWDQLNNPLIYLPTETADAATSGQSNNDMRNSHNSRVAPTTPQMMDLLFPTASKPHPLQYTGVNQSGSCNSDAAAAAAPAPEAKYDVAQAFAGIPFGAHSHLQRPVAPYVFEACPDEYCNGSQLPVTSLAACCEDLTIRSTVSSSVCSSSEKDVHGVTMCCPPACPSTIDSLLPCGQAESSIFFCTDASCSDPSCGQPFAASSDKYSSHTGPSVPGDGCVSVCDGVVPTETLYEECGDCSAAGVPPAETRVNFAQSLHNLFLDCCHECPEEQHYETCCSSDNLQQSSTLSAIPYGTPTPAVTLRGRSTVDPISTATSNHTTPRSHFTESPMPSKAPRLQVATSDGCRFGQPHQHDPSGFCFAPPMSLWEQSNYEAASTKEVKPSTSNHGTLRTVSCKWAGCSHICSDLSALAAHVHGVHLVPQESHAKTAYDAWPVTLAVERTDANLASSNHANHCQWDSCGQLHLPHGVSASADTVLEHLLQVHFSNSSPMTAPAADVNASTVCSASSSPKLQNVLTASAIASPAHRQQHNRKRRLSVTQAYGQSTAQLPLRRVKQASSMADATTPSVDQVSSTGSGWKDGNYALSPGASSSWTEDHTCGWIDCWEHFDSHQALTDHIAQDHVGGGKSSYTCGWVGCQRGTVGKTFQQRQKILRHLQTHTGDRPYKCTVCSRRFSEANTLSQHMRTHTHEKPYLCDYPGCGARFAVAGSLTIHKRSRHTNERPFVCTWPGCKRAFAESSNLTKHRRVHSGERPFGCDKCDRRFSRPDQLSRHAKVHEGKKG